MERQLNPQKLTTIETYQLQRIATELLSTASKETVLSTLSIYACSQKQHCSTIKTNVNIT
ncbi:hypothetical protein MKZ08_14470 [Viridibacillus sp. FSL R5-0477]|uniref:hypothetical protein n=1 Tax=Viridibacillus TaxID=496496 RepID=UPI00056F417C|nr:MULTISPECIES: hypothetical protein [Viridibacillus]OMC78390.1 hypothetical protein BK130_20340 [Viridibacillus sp. FSL H8-0123]OMC81880.1 hypothetical protein BK128_21175 [Viridibacillus sp. FSL H7-0596]OMC93005.1 hypothetical protein BK137_00285 [Viridibacillus arenosi]